MKKEKTVKTYQRRTKSGKIVTVRQHTASYDAADKAKNAAKRKGAGKELEEVKSKKSLQKADLFDGYDFTKDDFNEWYEGTGSAADKKVAKALRKTLGRKAYNELNNLAADNYKKGGANSFFKKNVHSTATAKTGKSTNSGKPSSAKTENAKEKAAEAKTSKSNWRKTADVPLRKKGDMAVGSMNVGKRAIEFEVRPADRGYEVTLYARYGKNDADYLKNIHISTLSDLSKHVRSEIAPRRKLTSRLMDDGEIHYDTIRVKSKKLESQEL